MNNRLLDFDQYIRTYHFNYVLMNKGKNLWKKVEFERKGKSSHRTPLNFFASNYEPRKLGYLLILLIFDWNFSTFRKRSKWSNSELKKRSISLFGMYLSLLTHQSAGSIIFQSRENRFYISITLSIFDKKNSKVFKNFEKKIYSRVISGGNE